MTDKPAESAVERYNALEWVPDGEMGFDPGGREVKAAADAAIAALLARVEELSNQREQSHAAFHIQKVRADRAEEVIRTLEMMLAAAEERLRVCGTCTHQDIDVDDDGSVYMSHPFVRYECDCHFPGEDYPEENDWPQGKDWGTAKNHDRCHFTPSRWTEATNEAH